VSHLNPPRVGDAMPVDLEEFEGGLARVAAEPWPGSWPADGVLPRPTAGARRAIGAVAERVRTSSLVAPIAIAIISRLYSSLLLALTPLLQESSAIPRLTGFGSPFLQWDSQWYITIANWGYHAAPMQTGPLGGRHDFAFFPAWPTLLRGVEALGFQASDIAAPLANALFVVAAVLVFVVLRREFGRTPALWGVALLAFAPPAFVLSMAYSEPLFLLLVGALFVTRTGPIRAVLGGLLGVTRLSGVAVAAASGLRWLRDWRDWRALVTAAGIGLGFGAWWIFIWQLTGDPLGWFQGSAQWGASLGLNAIQAALLEGPNPRWGSLLFVGLILGASIVLARRNLELGTYSVVAIGLSILGAPVESMPRHALIAFPAFGLIASRLSPRASLGLVLVFAAIQANYVVLSFIGPAPFAP
jgi:hypothetical protein